MASVFNLNPSTVYNLSNPYPSLMVSEYRDGGTNTVGEMSLSSLATLNVVM